MPRVVDKEKKKAEILQVAMQVFADKGITKTKMIDIATAASIGKGTIYEYFRSKEDIFGEAFNAFFQSMEHALTDSIESVEDPVHKLEKLVEISFSQLHENSQFVGIMMDFWAEGIRNKDERIQTIVSLEIIYSKYRKLIAGILTDGIEKGVFRNTDIHSVSAILIAALDGIFLQWIMDRNLFDIHQLSRSFIDTFLNGIKK